MSQEQMQKVVVTTPGPLRDAVEEALLSAGIDTEFAPPVPADVDAAVQRAAAVVCTADTEWRTLIRRCAEVPVIVLLQFDNAHLWASAFMEGAFDAVILGEDRTSLVRSVTKALAWRSRKQLMREALVHNPLAGTFSRPESETNELGTHGSSKNFTEL